MLRGPGPADLEVPLGGAEHPLSSPSLPGPISDDRGNPLAILPPEARPRRRPSQRAPVMADVCLVCWPRRPHGSLIGLHPPGSRASPEHADIGHVDGESIDAAPTQHS